MVMEHTMDTNVHDIAQILEGQDLKVMVMKSYRNGFTGRQMETKLMGTLLSEIEAYG